MIAFMSASIPWDARALDKETLRRNARAQRRDAFRAHAPQAFAAMADHFFKEIPFKPGAVIAGYWPIGEEADPRPILTRAHVFGHTCALPAVVRPDQPLAFRRWQSGDALVKGMYAIPSPRPRAPLVRPDIIIAPLLACDEAGHRLGYGGGFYDRTIARLRDQRAILVVGIGYAAQQIGCLPVDEFDQPLDWLVTEAGVNRFSDGSRMSA